MFLQELFAESVDTILYHGGNKPISKFSIPAHGVYLSPHIEWAEHYGSAITAAKVDASNVYKIDYTHDIDEDIFDALLDRDYHKVAEFIKMLKSLGYQAMQTVSDSEMVVVFPGTNIQVVNNKTLTESLSRVAYHYTNTLAALKILKSGQFQLSSALGSVEQQYMPRGKPYFMSTTRTKTGGYHQGGMRRGVLFVLDGNWFNQHYKSGPIDYWGNRGTSMRASEAEDRVYSAEPTIPIGGVTAVHVFFDVENEDNEEQRAHDQSIIREILIAAKTQGIPAFYYTDKNAWLAMDTRRAADVRQLTGSRKPAWYRPMRRRTYMQNWLELMQASAQNQLSRDAERTRYNLNYDYDRAEAAKSLANDMSNARKPDAGQERDDAVKIIRYMQQHRLNTIPEFVDHIAAKWATKKS